MELITGWEQFVDTHTVQVGDQQFTARQIMVAVGGRPQRLTIPGGELCWVSDDLFLQQDLPSSILIIGAGYIACEFACILRGLGVSVTQVVRGPRLLRGFDSELAEAVLDGMKEAGIHVICNATLESVHRDQHQLTATLEDGLQIPCGG